MKSPVAIGDRSLGQTVGAAEKCAELAAEAYKMREERVRSGLQALRASIEKRAILPAGQIVGCGGEITLIDELLASLGDSQ